MLVAPRHLSVHVKPSVLSVCFHSYLNHGVYNSMIDNALTYYVYETKDISIHSTHTIPLQCG